MNFIKKVLLTLLLAAGISQEGQAGKKITYFFGWPMMIGSLFNPGLMHRALKKHSPWYARHTNTTVNFLETQKSIIAELEKKRIEYSRLTTSDFSGRKRLASQILSKLRHLDSITNQLILMVKTDFAAKMIFQKTENETLACSKLLCGSQVDR